MAQKGTWWISLQNKTGSNWLTEETIDTKQTVKHRLVEHGKHWEKDQIFKNTKEEKRFITETKDNYKNVFTVIA